MQKSNLVEKFTLFFDRWSPKIIAVLNRQQVKLLVKSLGEFPWHHYEDELFYVVHGWFRMEFRDRSVVLRKGEMIVVPRGVEHRPVTEEEVSLLLFVPASPVNTGSADGGHTVARPDWICSRPGHP